MMPFQSEKFTTPTSSRPDFFLGDLSVEKTSIVLIGIDEGQHRQNRCEFGRISNIYTALSNEFDVKTMYYIRVNPDGYNVIDGDGKKRYFKPPRDEIWQQVLTILERIKSGQYVLLLIKKLFKCQGLRWSSVDLCQL